MRDMIDNLRDGTHTSGMSWIGVVTPRRDGGFSRICRSVRAAALALWRETAPPD